jgi:beta-lactamase family protein
VLLALLVAGLALGSGAPAATLAARPAVERPSRVIQLPGQPSRFSEYTLAALSPEAASYLHGREGSIGVAVIDPAHRAVYLANGTRRYALDSVVKVPLMLTVLDRAMHEERQPTDWELDLLESMITVSDNDATDVLWTDVGGSATVRAYLRSLGLSKVRFDPDERWGDTRASARDLALLLEVLVDGATLDPASRDLALDLMSRVIPEQRWGVADALVEPPPDTLVGLKNGWWPDEDGWQVNSTGFVLPGDGRPPYALAILTRDQPSLEDGLETIEGLARLIHEALLNPSHSPSSPGLV